MKNILRFLCQMQLFIMVGSPCLQAQEKISKTPISSDQESEKSCSFLLDNVLVHYKKLLTYLPKDKVSAVTSKYGSLLAIMSEKKPSCQDPDQAAKILLLAGKLLSIHSGQVGLLLPDTPKQSGATQSVLSGMKAYYTSKGTDFGKRVVVKDVANDANAILRRVAELVFVDQVGFLIGGLNELESGLLTDWADKLMVPVLLLSPYYSGTIPKKYVFHIFPRADDLVGRIQQHILSRGLKRIAIMYPMKPKPSRVIAQLMETLPKKGITISQSLSYNPSDYNSMEMAARQLLQIDKTLRAEEYEKMVLQAKEKAEKEKIEFAPERLTLPPIIDFDALILPDNFRNVRHFVQIFKFLKVKSALPMIGTQEWRAFGLINPPEPLLDRSVFVDYIGSYLEIPGGINPMLYSPPFFVNPEDTAKIDYMIIGYQASRMANLAMQKPPTKRRKLADRLLTLQNTGSSYFPQGPAFTSDHTAYWPSFLFEVSGSTIRLSQGGSLSPVSSPKSEATVPPTPPLKASSLPPTSGSFPPKPQQAGVQSISPSPKPSTGAGGATSIPDN